jgi:hypothetical protein
MFTFSIICASYLLVSLPGFYARNAGSLDAENFGNEAAFIRVWRRPWLPQTGIPSAILAAAEKIGGRISPRMIHLNNLIAAEHATFVLGVLFFALFIAFKAI